MKSFLLRLSAFALLSQVAIANASISPPSIAPQPTACITSQFSSTGNQYWKSITLKLTNSCGTTVDFQNTTVTFQNGIPLNTNFWGNFNPLPYPDGNMNISSAAQPDGKYLATLNLHFPSYPGSSTKLPAGRTIQIKYGATSEAHVEGTTNVYLGDTPPPPITGNIELINASTKPSDVSQNYALVHVTMNGQNISNVQLPWNGKQTLPGLTAGTYTIAAESINGTSGNTYQGTAQPASVTVVAQQTAQSTITYTVVEQTGKLAVRLQELPPEIIGYPTKPTVTLTAGGSSIPLSVDWNSTATATQLKTGTSYTFSTPSISFNNAMCTPTFTPGSLVASDAAEVPTTNLTYTCSQVAQNTVTLNVSGAPTSLASLAVTLTPNNNTSPVVKTISLNNGSGTDTVMLPNGVVYTVSAPPVSGYTINFNPQPLTSTPNATETITLTEQASGTPVAINGRLKVCGTQLCNQHNQPIQLRGMSTHGLQWYGWGKCVTAGSLDALANDFKASAIRISMYVQEGGYETNPTAFTNQVNQIIEEATKRGIYAIVDWHQLTPGDPNANLERAKTFFTAIATAHKDKVNLLYDICNEPNGVAWSRVKTYADALIPVIRAIDPNTPILIGTHGWASLGISDGRTSQDIINNPVNFPNIMYTFHFYAASHRDEYLNELDKASNTLPIFVTEFGTQTYSGDGGNDFAMTDRYMQLMSTKKIGWTNWNYSDDFRSGAVWKTGTCPNGAWTDANLKPAGVYIKGKIKG